MTQRQFIIADNQDLTALAAQGLIASQCDAVALRVGCKSELLARLQDNADSVVMLDYTLFDFNDADSLINVSERYASTSWLLMSDELTTDFLRRVVLASHSFSVVFKDAPLREIKEAVAAVSQRQRFLSPKATEMLLSQQSEDLPPVVLTTTELEIAKAIAQGKSNKEIAAERVSSVHTITTHRKNIFRKLGVNTAYEVMRYALRAGWVDSAEFYI